ncbi:hypothetical protein CERZMDRAFT_92122 [Cercospora zeae-maydis SCOH1-5]|uniref:Uncharacterized protein n=1 Tax=Cercospora zeae-maydis SCOH1-5 TaxID=717836 RepID=A0A6A6FVL8_9PEZI|nr:hypothetical protein CERZMDRAFT_92122 [Cercospora zeae-maydis SCOH1-5]
MADSPNLPPALSQAGYFLQAIFYAWREVALRWKLRSYNHHEPGPGINVSIDTRSTYGQDDGGSIFDDFPNLQGPSPVGKIVLAYYGCGDALCFMYHVVKPVFDALLSDRIITKVEEVRVEIKLTKKFVFAVSEGAPHGQAAHALYRVETLSGEQYAVDLSGPQYGILDRPVVPWTEYRDGYVEKVLAIVDFGQHFAQTSSMQAHEPTFVMARDMDEAIQHWCESKKLKLGDVLMMGGGREFEHAQAEICHAVSESVREGARKRMAEEADDE